MKLQTKIILNLQKRGIILNIIQKRIKKLFEEIGELLEAIYEYECEPIEENLTKVKKELADCGILIFSLAYYYGVDLLEAIEEKLEEDKGKGVN